MSKRKLDYPHLTPEEQGAIKRLMADESYKAAVDWLLYKACHIADLSYRPESQRDTDFAEGARFVGLSFVRAAKLPMTETTKEEPYARGKRGPRR